MSAVAVPHRSLFENISTGPVAVKDEMPHRGTARMRIWRELPATQAEPQRAVTNECADEDCERWDGLA